MTSEAPSRSLSDSPEAFDWNARYASAETPWDLGAAHPELEARRDEPELSPGAGVRALVPGCGRGHDALELARRGFDVLAVDGVAELGADLRPRLAAIGGEFVAGDALDVREGPFDLILEHTFFCALPPADRPRWAAMVDANLAEGGRLVVLAFPVDKPFEDGGPPWRAGATELAEALGDGFRLVRDEPLRAPLARRTWLERWVVFERS